jgi:hypothetical protein
VASAVIRSRRSPPPWQRRGALCAILVDLDRSIESLERAREERVDWFPWIGGQKAYDHFMALALENLRGDPRFERLVAPLRIPSPS